MELKNKYFYVILLLSYQTPLYLAVKKQDVEIVQLLLANEKLDVNYLNILSYLH